MDNLPPSSEQIKTQKALIGEFIILFENINEWIRFIIPRIILLNFSDQLGINNIHTLLEGLTSDPLRNKLDSLINDNFSEFATVTLINKKLSKKVTELPQIRNSIAHGTYRLGWEDHVGNLNPEFFSLMHPKATKNGFEKRSKIIEIKTIEKLIFQMKLIMDCYANLTSIITQINLGKNETDITKFITLIENNLKEIGTIELKYK
jgi:hypothetical protein